MKTLHILRSSPDETTSDLISRTQQRDEGKVVRLFDDEVDYNLLLADVFLSERVICWW